MGNVWNFIVTAGNPFKRPAADFLVAPAHLVLSVLWLGGLAAFTTFTLLNFLSRPFAETVALAQMDAALPSGLLQVNITTRCDPVGQCGFITATQKFNDTRALTAPCHRPVPKDKRNSTTIVTSFSDLKLCPLPLNNPVQAGWAGEGLRLDFSAVATNVSVSEVTVQSGEFATTITLESWQRKTLIIGVIKKVDSTGGDGGGPVVTHQPFFSNLQYDGKHETKWATLRIELSQFATVIERSRPGTVYELIGEIGGFSGLIFTVLKLISLMIPTKVVEPPERARRRRKATTHERRSRSRPRTNPTSPRGNKTASSFTEGDRTAADDTELN